MGGSAPISSDLSPPANISMIQVSNSLLGTLPPLDPRVCAPTSIAPVAGSNGLNDSIVSGSSNSIASDLNGLLASGSNGSISPILNDAIVGSNLCVTAPIALDTSTPPVLTDAHSFPALGNAATKNPVPSLSYSNIVRGKLKHVDLQISVVDGRSIAKVPEDVLANSTPLWDDLIIGRFPDVAPHVAKVHVIVNKIWPLREKKLMIDAYVVNDRIIKFRIRDKVVRERVLRRGMWNIANMPMMVSKWSPFIEDTQPLITTMPLWVTIKNVPHSLFTWEGLSCLASPIGYPQRLHPDTELCKRFDEAKIFVDVNLMQEIPKSFTFELRGEEITVNYSYPWLPPRCSACSKWGHLRPACVQLVMLQDENSDQIANGSISHPVEADVGVVENEVGIGHPTNLVVDEGGDDSTKQLPVALIGASSPTPHLKDKRALHNSSIGSIAQEGKENLSGAKSQSMADDATYGIKGIEQKENLRDNPISGDIPSRDKLRPRDDTQWLTPLKPSCNNIPSSQVEQMQLEIRSSFLPKWADQIKDEDENDEIHEVESIHDSDHSADATLTPRLRHNKKVQNQKQLSSDQRNQGKKGQNKKKQNSDQKGRGKRGRRRF